MIKINNVLYIINKVLIKCIVIKLIKCIEKESESNSKQLSMILNAQFLFDYTLPR